jgi:hypothetical protein
LPSVLIENLVSDSFGNGESQMCRARGHSTRQLCLEFIDVRVRVFRLNLKEDTRLLSRRIRQNLRARFIRRRARTDDAAHRLPEMR